MIRIPVHMVETVNKYKKAFDNYVDKYGEEPDDDYMSDIIKLPLEKIEEIKRVILTQTTVSLSAPVGEDEDGDTLGDMLASNEEMVHEKAEDNLLKAAINEVLPTLTEREEEVIRMRYGLEPYHKPYTLEEIGKVYHLTRERIRQIEAKALRKLKHPTRSRKLKDYVD